MLELSKHYGTGTVTAGSIAEAQHVPARFLESILGSLRQAGLVDSVRGKDGGYRLSRSPEELTLGDVIRSIQGPLATVDCHAGEGARGSLDGRECVFLRGCVLLPVWKRAQDAMMAVYDETGFADLVRQEAARGGEVLDYAI